MCGRGRSVGGGVPRGAEGGVGVLVAEYVGVDGVADFW